MDRSRFVCSHRPPRLACVDSRKAWGSVAGGVKMILKNSRNNGEPSCDLGPNRLPTPTAANGRGGGRSLRRGHKLLFKLTPLIVQQS